MNKDKYTPTVALDSYIGVQECKEILLNNLDKVHTTELGIERIKKNLNLTTDDVVKFCVNKVKERNCVITRKGKNWYAEIDHCIITINAYNYSIITAHKK